MRKLLLTIAYDGRPYHGWQIQQNALTVQAVLQQALAAVLGAAPPIKGCSRTDTGVHARRFCVSIETENAIPCERLVMALNAHLPDSVAALDCREVPEDFHARYNALGKQYSYEIWNSPRRNPFLCGLATHYPVRLDETSMKLNGLPLLGTHDFASFCAAGSSVEDTVRTVSHFDVVREGDMVRIVIAADGFLYNMVRIIAGTLIDMERGRLEKGSMAAMIEAKDRSAAGYTAPPEGLYLEQVFYDLDD